MENVKNKKEKFLLLPLLVLMCAQIGASGDNSILSVATGSLISELNANMNDIQIANLVYSLCAGALMVAGGMMGIIIGWKKNFRIGITLAMFGELVLAVSTNMVMFNWGGRLLVGIGASLMIPSVLGIVASLYSGKDRAVAFGVIGAATGIAAAAGPIAAGFLIDHFGFRIAFSCLAGYFFLVLLGSLSIPAIEKSPTKLKLDIKGILLAAVSLAMFLLGLSKVSVWGLGKATSAAPFSIVGLSPALPMAVVGLILFFILLKMEKEVEKKEQGVLIPSSFIKTPQVRNGLYASAMIFLYLGGLVILVNPYLQVVLGYNALRTGLAMTFMGLPLFALSILIPKYFSHIHPKVFLKSGYVVLAIAPVVFMFSLHQESVNFWFYIAMVLSGIGQGLLSSQASAIVALAVNKRDAEQSGGLQATSRNVGQAMGVAVLGLVLLYGMTAAFNNRVSTSDLPKDVVTQLQDKNIKFASNADFEKEISDVNLTKSEKEQVMSINADSRIKATRYGLAALSIFSVLFFFGTNGVTKIEE